MFRVHDPRSEPATRAEQDAARNGQGNWPDGGNYPPQVHDDWAAAETEHMWGGDDPAFKISWCSVALLSLLLPSYQCWWYSLVRVLGYVHLSVHVSVIFMFFHMISQKPMLWGSLNLTYKCFTVSHGNPFILGSKGQRSMSRGTKNSAGVGFCTLVNARFFLSSITICLAPIWG